MEYISISEYIEEKQEEIIRDIQDSIRIESVKSEALPDAPYGIGPKEALEHALALAEGMGFRVKNVGNKVGWAEYGEGTEMIAVLGHLDVVPKGEGWTLPAFEGRIQDGRLYGRGVVDDKGSTIGALHAMAAIRDLGIPLERRIRVIFGTDEESGCRCISHYVEAGEEIPATGFTPDGDYPIIFCEKGMTTLTVGKNKRTPSIVKIKNFGGGTAKNIVTEKCILELEGRFNPCEKDGISVSYQDESTYITANGVGAHGSKPHLGRNAAILLMKAVKSIPFGGSFQDMRDFILDKIGDEINGKELGIYYSHEETGETTVNVGMLRMEGESITCTLDIRYPHNGKHDHVYKAVERALGEYNLEIIECSTEKALYVPKDSPLLQKLMKVYQAMTGRTDEPIAIGGGTYAKKLPNMVAFGPHFPDSEDVVHKPDENVLVTDLIKSIQITAAAMAELASCAAKQ